jgi:hypothetical protein
MSVEAIGATTIGVRVVCALAPVPAATRTRAQMRSLARIFSANSLRIEDVSAAVSASDGVGP